jgi:hypothetical protein
MLSKMTSRQFVEWMAWEQIDGPIGQGRADYLAAMQMALIANVNRGKSGRKYSIADFLPQWDRSARKTNSGGGPRQLLDKLKKFTKARKGTISGFSE